MHDVDWLFGQLCTWIAALGQVTRTTEEACLLMIFSTCALAAGGEFVSLTEQLTPPASLYEDLSKLQHIMG